MKISGFSFYLIQSFCDDLRHFQPLKREDNSSVSTLNIYSERAPQLVSTEQFFFLQRKTFRARKRFSRKLALCELFYGPRTQIINHFASHNPLIQSRANVLCMMLFSVINQKPKAPLTLRNSHDIYGGSKKCSQPSHGDKSNDYEIIPVESVPHSLSLR